VDDVPRPRPAGQRGDGGLDVPADLRRHRPAVGPAHDRCRRADDPRAPGDAAGHGRRDAPAAGRVHPPPRPLRRRGGRDRAGDVMNPLAKLTGFAGVAALVFAGAAFAGSRIDVHPGRADQATEHGMGAMAAEHKMAPDPLRGLAVSEHGLTLELARGTAPQGKPFELRFRIGDRRGATVRHFDVEHTKRMHLIVVRRDMTGFQHLHPTESRDGTWSVPVTLPVAGSYRVFADFSVDGRPYTLADDVTVDGSVHSEQLPAPVRSVDVDGLNVSLSERATKAGAESALGFAVTRDGKPVAIQDYLGAKGHLVALREGDLAFLHVHPDENSLRF